MMTAGVMTAVATRASKYGGVYYECTIKGETQDYMVLVDPKMQNYHRNWQEILSIKEKSIMQDYGILLDNLKELEKDGKVVLNRLDADVKPTFHGTVPLDKVRTLGAK